MFPFESDKLNRRKKLLQETFFELVIGHFIKELNQLFDKRNEQIEETRKNKKNLMRLLIFNANTDLATSPQLVKQTLYFAFLLMN